MKKMRIALIVALMMTMFAATALAGTMYVNRANQKSIKLYNGEDQVICTIPYRAAVQTSSRSKIDNERMVVTYNGREGWVYSRYLSSTKPPKAGSSSSSSKKSSSSSSSSESNPFDGMKMVDSYIVVVRPSTPTSYVNLRWAPTKKSQIQGVRYNGDELRVIAENKSWAQVIDDSTGECGFMQRSFLEKVVAGG